mmetsp:Transcript_34760/g.85536  ORF Transcript_34760/g.85536 Transcript_34760/m.85536 type:complete len:257 (+) Transcript_34760:591-1361(+)
MCAPAPPPACVACLVSSPLVVVLLAPVSRPVQVPVAQEAPPGPERAPALDARVQARVPLPPTPLARVAPLPARKQVGMALTPPTTPPLPAVAALQPESPEAAAAAAGVPKGSSTLPPPEPLALVSCAPACPQGLMANAPRAAPPLVKSPAEVPTSPTPIPARVAATPVLGVLPPPAPAARIARLPTRPRLRVAHAPSLRPPLPLETARTRFDAAAHAAAVAAAPGLGVLLVPAPPLACVAPFPDGPLSGMADTPGA